MTRFMFSTPKNRWYYRLTLATVLLAFVLLLLGNSNRLTGANLSCTTWSKCLTQAQTLAVSASASKQIYSQQLWAEMTYRVLTFASVVAIIWLTLAAMFITAEYGYGPFIIGFSLIGIVCWEMVLQMQPLSLKSQPTFMLLQLTAELGTVILLWWNSRLTYPDYHVSASTALKKFAPWLWLGLLLLLAEIAFSTWAGLHHANAVCTHSPYCRDQLFSWLAKDKLKAIFYTHTLSPSQLVSLAMLYRVSLIVVASYISFISFLLFCSQSATSAACLIFTLLMIEMTFCVLHLTQVQSTSMQLGYQATTILIALAFTSLLIRLYRKSNNALYG